MSNYDNYLQSSLSHLTHYLNEMKSRPILFIGSGFSRRYINSPSWYELLERLINENPEISLPIEYFIQEHDRDYAKIASQLVDYYRDYAWKNRAQVELFPPALFTSTSKSIFLKYKISTILKDITQNFNPITNRWREEIELFRKLTPHAIVTTNYDSILENLFPKYVAITGQQIFNEKKSTNIGRILKIHGSVDEIEGIVIEKKDYELFFKKQIYLIAKIFTYFMEHPIIFIGYSLNDENIKSILYNVKQIINPDAEPMIPNMWFIDWSSESLNPNLTPMREKSVAIGNGESVRLNYIILHTYDDLYRALYQDSIDMEILKNIEETVYNVVKSDSITNLEVDIASLRYLTDRESFLNTFTAPAKEAVEGKQFLTFAEITDPNQLASQFPLTPTQLCERVYDGTQSFWYHVYKLIDKVCVQIGINLRGSNNNYYVSMNGVSRFSIEMVDLLKKVKDNEPYTVNIDGQQLSYPLPMEAV